MNGRRILVGFLVLAVAVYFIKILAILWLASVSATALAGLTIMTVNAIRDRRERRAIQLRDAVDTFGRQARDVIDVDLRTALESARRDIADPAWWEREGFMHTAATVAAATPAAKPAGKPGPKHEWVPGYKGCTCGWKSDTLDFRSHLNHVEAIRADIAAVVAATGVPRPILGAPAGATPGEIYNGEDGRMHCRRHMVVSGGYPGTPETIIDAPAFGCAVCAMVTGRYAPIQHVAPGTE